MRGDVQAFALFFFGYAQPDRQVHQLVGDERHHAGPDHRQSDRLGLRDHLGHHVVVGDLVGRIVEPAGSAERRGGQEAGADGADDAADAVHTEHVEGVVVAQRILDRRAEEQADDAGDDTEHDADGEHGVDAEHGEHDEELVVLQLQRQERHEVEVEAAEAVGDVVAALRIDRAAVPRQQRVVVRIVVVFEEVPAGDVVDISVGVVVDADDARRADLGAGLVADADL